MSAAATAPGVAVHRRRVAGIAWPLAPDLSAALGLGVATLAFYYPLVFLGRILVDYDAFVYFFPQRAYLAQSLLAGRIPLWDPNLFLGVPFLANPQSAVLYPPSWLFVLGPVATIYTVQLVLHAFLSAFFTYLLARHAFGLMPLAAALGGLAYAFGGFAVGQVGHLNQISAAAWLPAALFAYNRFAVSRRVVWLALGALALGLQLLAGHPQETYMTLIVLGIFGIVTAPWRHVPRVIAFGAAGAAMCALGAGVAAAQLLPTLELAPLSIRGAGVNWADAVAGSVPTYLAVRALLPPYWLDVPYTEFLGYVGVVAATLCLVGIARGPWRPAVFGAAVAFLGIFLALGENNATYGWFFTTAPGFDTFRVPARWLLLWEFGAAVLAAAGADWVGRGARVPLRSPTFWLRTALVLLIVGFAVYWQRTSGEAFPQRRTPLTFAALGAATLIVCALPHVVGRWNLALALLVAMTGIELWAAADGSPIRQAPPNAITDGEMVGWFRANGVTDQERLLSLARPEYVPVTEDAVRAQLSSVPTPLVDMLLEAQKYHDTLTPNVPLQYGLNTADGYDGGVLPLLRWLNLSGLIVQNPRADGVLLSRLDSLPSDQILDLLGVQYLVANSGYDTRPDLQTVDFGDLSVYVRTTPVPRSLVVFGVTPVADENAALDRMSAPDFDSNREVVIEGAAGATPVGAAPQPVTPDSVGPEQWHAHVTLSQPGYLLQREAWYPGWHARVDGADVPLLHADSLYRAVALSPGEHDVEISFDSSSFKRGAVVSLASLVVIMALLVWRPILRTRVQG